MKATVNGSAAEVDASADDPVVEPLRDGLGLTGTKLACGTGVCGACTILVDGTPSLACLLRDTVLEVLELALVVGG